MAVQFDTLDNRSGEMWVSPERYFLTQDGRVVLEGNANAAFLLVGKGGSLPYDEAVRHGLLDRSVNTPEPEPPIELAATVDEPVLDVPQPEPPPVPEPESVKSKTRKK